MSQVSPVSTLRIRAPQQHEFRNPAVMRDPAQVRAWLENLPILNLSATLKQINDALDSINHESLADKLRLKLLGCFHDTLVALYPSAEPLCLQRLPIGNQQRQESLTDMQLLCQLLADGYKIIVRDLYQAGEAVRQSEHFTTGLYCALDSLGHGLLHAYRCHRDVPVGLYEECHSLFRLAGELDVLDATVTTESAAIEVQTLRALYKRLLILAACDPYHLQPGQAAHLHQHVAPLASHAKLQVQSDAHTPAYDQYFINLELDRGPQRLDLANDTEAVPRRLFLNLAPLKQVLQQMHQAGRLPDSLKPLLPRAQPGERKPRNKDSARAVVLCDIPSIFLYLTQGQSNNSPWKLEDRSDGGYRLRCPREASPQLGVGDILGVIDTKLEGMVLAQIRWLKQDKQQDIFVGCEFVHARCSPARMRLSAEQSQRGQREHFGLLLENAQKRLSLILPKGVYRRERQVSMRTPQYEHQVCLEYLIEDTRSFDHCQIKIVE